MSQSLILSNFVTLLAVTSFATSVSAAEPLREMSTDRPDKTESPYSVDAGHFQLEMDIANLTRDVTDDGKIVSYGIAPFNIKVGKKLAVPDPSSPADFWVVPASPSTALSSMQF